jgi:hypothetical protein
MLSVVEGVLTGSVILAFCDVSLAQVHWPRSQQFLASPLGEPHDFATAYGRSLQF